MDVLLGFLIGMAYPPMLVIVVASLRAARVSFGVIAGTVTLIMLAGPVVWAMTFVALGVGAGFAAFGGWLIGLGIAGLMFAIFVSSKVRQIRNVGSQPPSAVGR